MNRYIKYVANCTTLFMLTNTPIWGQTNAQSAPPILYDPTSESYESYANPYYKGTPDPTFADPTTDSYDSYRRTNQDEVSPYITPGPNFLDLVE